MLANRENALSSEGLLEGAVGAAKAPVRGLTDDIDAVIALSESRDGGILLGEVEETLHGRGAGLLILVLSMPFVFPLPIPLLAAACGIPMMALGIRMALFGESALPRFARRAELSPETLRAVARGLRTALRPFAYAFRPRLQVVFRSAPWRLIGLSVCLAAFLLSLPLPIPFANLIPAVGLILMAVGLLQRDGLAVCVGHGFTLGSYLYLYFIWETAVAVLRRLFA